MRGQQNGDNQSNNNCKFIIFLGLYYYCSLDIMRQHNLNIVMVTILGLKTYPIVLFSILDIMGQYNLFSYKLLQVILKILGLKLGISGELLYTLKLNNSVYILWHMHVRYIQWGELQLQT